MNEYVIKKWNVAAEAASKAASIANNQSLVEIQGRAPGFISWLLSLANIDPSMKMDVNRLNIVFETGGWEGFEKAVIPVRNISSVYYGNKKPWKEALAILTVGFVIASYLLSLHWSVGLIGYLAALGYTGYYYIYNKKLTLGVWETGGENRFIAFKSSLLEGERIDDKRAVEVVTVIQSLIDERS